MRTIYIAQFSSGGGAGLAMVEVSKETAKTFFVADYKNILGWTYVGQRIRKSDDNWFDSPSDALTYLIERADKRIAYLETSVKKVRQEPLELRELAIEAGMVEAAG